MFGCLVWVGQTGFVDVTPSSLYKGHRYPVEVISHCVWLYHRFPLSLREVEEMVLSERPWGADASSGPHVGGPQ